MVLRIGINLGDVIVESGGLYAAPRRLGDAGRGRRDLCVRQMRDEVGRNAAVVFVDLNWCALSPTMGGLLSLAGERVVPALVLVQLPI